METWPLTCLSTLRSPPSVTTVKVIVSPAVYVCLSSDAVNAIAASSGRVEVVLGGCGQQLVSARAGVVLTGEVRAAVVGPGRGRREALPAGHVAARGHVEREVGVRGDRAV